jgi:seryl-tRNA synthetase
VRATRNFIKRWSQRLLDYDRELPDGQAKQKWANSKEMSLLAVQKQQLALETQREKKQATKEKLQHEHKKKKSLIKYTAQIRGEEKAKDLVAKDQIRKEKVDKATSRLSMAASAMNHQNYALRVSTYPPSTPSQSHVVNDNTVGRVSTPA